MSETDDNKFKRLEKELESLKLTDDKVLNHKQTNIISRIYFIYIILKRYLFKNKNNNSLIYFHMLYYILILNQIKIKFSGKSYCV